MFFIKLNKGRSFKSILFLTICLGLLIQDSKQCDYLDVLALSPPTQYSYTMQQLGNTVDLFNGKSFRWRENLKNQALTFTREKTNNLEKGSSADLKWILYDGVSFNSLQSCLTQTSSEIIDSIEKLDQFVKSFITIKEGYPKGIFSQNEEYLEIKQDLLDRTHIYIITEAKCILGEARLQETLNTHLLLSLDLVQDFNKISTEGYPKEMYYKFFDKYGTHVVSRIKKGSRIRTIYKIRKEDAQELQNAGFNLSEGAISYTNQNILKIPYLKTLSSIKFAEKIPSITIKYEMYPSDEPEKTINSFWEQYLSKNFQQILEVDLITFEKLLDKYTKRDSMGLSAKQIQELKIGFHNHLSTYCSYYLLPNNKVTSCDTGQSTTSASILDSSRKQSIIERASANSIPLQIMVNNNYLKVNFKDNQQRLVVQSLKENIAEKKLHFNIYRLDTNVYLIKSFVDSMLCVSIENCQQQEKSYELILQPCEQQNMCQRFIFDSANNNQEYNITNEKTGLKLYLKGDTSKAIEDEEAAKIDQEGKFTSFKFKLSPLPQ